MIKIHLILIHHVLKYWMYLKILKLMKSYLQIVENQRRKENLSLILVQVIDKDILFKIYIPLINI